MRSSETFRSLERISNRFMLCQVISQSVRLMHKSGSPIEESVSEALRGIQAGKYRGESRLAAASLIIEPDSTVLFGLPDLL
jgi:hypothetical protein